MKVPWAQTAAGALGILVIAGLLTLPGRLLAPERQGPPLHLADRHTRVTVQAAPLTVVHYPAAGRLLVGTGSRQPYVRLAVTPRARATGLAAPGRTALAQAVPRTARHLPVPPAPIATAAPTPAPTATPVHAQAPAPVQVRSAAPATVEQPVRVLADALPQPGGNSQRSQAGSNAGSHGNAQGEHLGDGAHDVTPPGGHGLGHGR